MGKEVAPPTGKERRIVYFYERLGDRVIIKYMADLYKLHNPDCELYAYEELNYASVSDFTMREWGEDIFDAVFRGGEVVNGKSLSRGNADGLLCGSRLWPDPGNLFVMAPIKIKKTGIYPKLEIPKRHLSWLEKFIDGLGLTLEKLKTKPVVCFHILTDAGYSRSRNHDFYQVSRSIDLLSKEDVFIFRVGCRGSNVGVVGGGVSNVFDLTPLNLTPSQSIAVASLCDVYLGGDTGMTHATSALGKRVFGLWGDITHMLTDSSSPNNIRPGDWNTGPYVPEEKLYMLRRDRGPDRVAPIFSAERIMKGLDHLIHCGE